jgi:hypothetical protein
MVTPAKHKLILVLMVLVVGSSVAFAKQPAPKEVPPAVIGGIKYTAPHWCRINGKDQQGGYIEARDFNTGRLLWELRVYEIKYEPGLEQDVQDIFITSLKVMDGKLQVANEKGDKFVVDLAQRKVVQGRRRPYDFRR